MEPKAILKSVNRYYNGIDANSRSTDVFSDSLVNCNSFFSPYKAHVPQYEENIDSHQPYNASVSTTPDSSLFYVPWSTSGDDYKQLAGSQNNPNRSQTEMSDFGSAADLYGLVSNILEEPDQSQSLFVEGNTSSNLLRSIWSSTTSRYTEHLDHSSESKKPGDTSYSQPVFNTKESIAASDKPQYQQDSHLVSQQKINMEDFLGFDDLDLTEQWMFPSKKEATDCIPFQSTDGTKMNFQEFPYVKNCSKLQVGLPVSVREPGTDIHMYGRDGGDFKEVGAPSSQTSTELFPFLHNSRNSYNSNTGNRYMEQLHSSKFRQNKFVNFNIADGKTSADCIPELPVIEMDNCTRVSKGKQTQKGFDELNIDQHTLKYCVKSSGLSEKQLSKELGLGSDLGQKCTSECGRNPHTFCPIRSDFEKAFEKQQHSNYDHFSQQSEYVQPLNSLPVSVYSGESYQNRQSWTKLATSGSETTTTTSFGKPDNSSDLGNQASPASKTSSHSFCPSSHQSSMPFSQNSNAYFQRSTGIYGQDNHPKVPSSEFTYNVERVQPGTHIEGQNKASGDMYFESPIEKNCQNGKQVNGFHGSSSQQYVANKYPSYQTKQQNCHYDLNEDVKKKDDEFSQSMYRDLIGAQSYYYNHNSQQGAGDSNNVANYMTRSASFSSPYMMGDFRRNHNISQLGPRSVASGTNLQFGHPVVSLMDPSELFPYEEFSHLYPLFNDMFYGDASLYGFIPPFGFPRPMKNRSGPANELHIRLEECYEQWRALEKERKKVVTLLGKMERLRSSPLHANISTALDRHLEAIHITQARRKDEIVNAANRQRQGAPRYQDDRDVLALAIAVKEMAVATRKARTALWCALQMTLPKTPNANPDDQVEVERELQDLVTNGDKNYQNRSNYYNSGEKNEVVKTRVD
ncbi:meiosis-specific coiled-coil domain-containing protein MEIOC isoform X2 [Scyliorhinus canicula]|uniref:meiosis-specific coiled-coil domain-containing protein MEIOC isoform X2 n=1 Tax=Scyliorhinus canicula TaxID=7830 RepID=UPI0018F6C68B|nr:meiosis-specific coiled-coil domain-containing protein MEIOC isoform X2 [Scyliorhinus canicula]